MTSHAPRGEGVRCPAHHVEFGEATAEAVAREIWEETGVGLFRSLSGRRSVEQLLDREWDGDPAAYIDVLSPYPCPPSAVSE